jgi:hypothetical protein
VDQSVAHPPRQLPSRRSRSINVGEATAGEGIALRHGMQVASNGTGRLEGHPTQRYVVFGQMNTTSGAYPRGVDEMKEAGLARQEGPSARTSARQSLTRQHDIRLYNPTLARYHYHSCLWIRRYRPREMDSL